MSEAPSNPEDHLGPVVDDGPPVQHVVARTEFRRRLYNTITVVLAVVSFFSFFVATSEAIQFAIERSYGLRIGASAALTGIVLLFLAITAGVLQYLQGGFTRLTAAPTSSHRSRSDHSSDAAADMLTTLQTKSASAEVAEDLHFRDVTRYSDEMMGRLGKAIEEQGRRNNINLSFGFFVSLLGIAALLFFVSQYKDIDPAKPWTILNFLPRLSLVILIELFAYFFLNLYRNGLVEVKYLQNELINVRMRTLGLRTAIREADKESAAHIMKAFGDTDRNAATKRSDPARVAPEEVLKTAQEALKLAGK